MSTKYIFVTGGVVSSLGKGITAASLGQLLKSRGLNVTIQKFDPYINVDPRNMSPYQHGEVFVTDDGAETDLDLGHYERFIDVNLNKNSNVTAGKVYWSVLNKERNGEYDGKTVQVIPHITNEISDRIIRASKEGEIDVVITEVGGTIGDIESLPFMEAIRQIKYVVGKENVMYIHVTLIPYLKKAGELKTKPTQHSVKELRGIGIQPDVLICRTELPLEDHLKEKLALFTDLKPSEVIENMDADSLYEIPLMLEEQGLSKLVIDHLGLETNELDLSHWHELIEKVKNIKGEVNIALIGKYVELQDAYISVVESLKHGGIENGVDIKIKWIQARDLDCENCQDILKGMHGILIPGGFDDRGVKGKLEAIEYARENQVPYLGISLGMQLAVVDYARNVLGLKDADSTEWNKETENPVIDLRPEQPDLDLQNGEIRLGLFPCKLKEDTLAKEIYNDELIYERHMNRYEINNEYKERLIEKGLIVSGISPDERLIEVVELKDHPWFIGVNFHPEFKSRPTHAHPLFREFIKAAIKNRK
ncbi:MAG: CTP synthase [Tissierella sp.]|uniref:CTP synthase n=1 Tax=Tissierella sp. TaxID=41274 RepID=UPI003F969884